MLYVLNVWSQMVQRYVVHAMRDRQAGGAASAPPSRISLSTTFPKKLLTDLSSSIDQLGIANAALVAELLQPEEEHT